MRDERLAWWVRAVISTPGLTAFREFETAWVELVARALLAVEVVRRYSGVVVDVGSGGGSPGIPLAAALPEREVVLLEAQERKASALARFASAFPNVRVVHGRAEEQQREVYGVAVARALAEPPVAAEWCLPLVHRGGAVVLYVGPTAERDRVQRAAGLVGGGRVEEHPGLLVIPKVAATPARFPRRPGVAKKRPLA